MLQRRQRRTDPRSYIGYTSCETLVKIGYVVPEICSHTDRRTHKHTRSSHIPPPHRVTGSLDCAPAPLREGLVHSRRSPSYRTRRNQCDATGWMASAPRCNSATHSNRLDMSPCGRPLCAYMTSSINRKYMTHRNADEEEPIEPRL